MPDTKNTVKEEKEAEPNNEPLPDDKSLMTEIEEKTRTGKKEDVIDSLIAFERNWRVLPEGPARDFIYRLLENDDTEIKRKAEEVYRRSLQESDEKIKRSLENLTESFNARFLAIQAQMKEVSDAFDISKEVDDIAKTITRIPKVGFDLQKLQSEQEGHEHDLVFNFKAYELLYVLERYLRALIQINIIEPNRGNLANKIRPEMIRGWQSRKKEEEKNPLIDGSYELIDYSDFTDLKQILEKGRNYTLFEDIMNQEHFKQVISKLHELDPIRKKIAHSRQLTKKEFNRLVLYTEDIQTIFTA